jgi:ABC-type long-subunit fatty acid transport system fused permease/ATPase subunit
MMALIILNVVGVVYFSYSLNNWGSALQSSTTWGQYKRIGLEFSIYILLFMATDISVYKYLLPRHTWWWQDALMDWYTDQWLAHPKSVGTAPQRIRECSRQIAETLSDISARGFRYLIGLFGFIPLAWSLSEHFQFILPIPGLLVWFTFLVCALETAVCLYLGRKLPNREKLIQEAEGRLRAMFEKIQRRRAKGQSIDAPVRTLPKLRAILGRRKFKYIDSSIPLEIWQQTRGNYWGYGIQWHIGIYVAVTLIIRQGVMSQTVAVLGELHKSLSIFSDSWQPMTQLQATVERIRELEFGSTKHRPPH